VSFAYIYKHVYDQYNHFQRAQNLSNARRRAHDVHVLVRVAKRLTVARHRTDRDMIIVAKSRPIMLCLLAFFVGVAFSDGRVPCPCPIFGALN
jgi:cytochrome c biogenesis protein CcdA